MCVIVLVYMLQNHVHTKSAVRTPESNPPYILCFLWANPIIILLICASMPKKTRLKGNTNPKLFFGQDSGLRRTPKLGHRSKKDENSTNLSDTYSLSANVSSPVRNFYRICVYSGINIGGQFKRCATTVRLDLTPPTNTIGKRKVRIRSFCFCAF